jgi:hypothetical protein
MFFELGRLPPNAIRDPAARAATSAPRESTTVGRDGRRYAEQVAGDDLADGPSGQVRAQTGPRNLVLERLRHPQPPCFVQQPVRAKHAHEECACHGHRIDGRERLVVECPTIRVCPAGVAAIPFRFNSVGVGRRTGQRKNAEAARQPGRADRYKVELRVQCVGEPGPVLCDHHLADERLARCSRNCTLRPLRRDGVVHVALAGHTAGGEQQPLGSSTFRPTAI